MSKKTFSNGLNSLLGESNLELNPIKSIEKSELKNTKDNEIRASFIVNKKFLDKIKAIAYWERKLIKDIFNGFLEESISKYENKNGIVKPIPENSK